MNEKFLGSVKQIRVTTAGTMKTDIGRNHSTRLPRELAMELIVNGENNRCSMWMEM